MDMSTNPIAERLEQLYDHWAEFIANEPARLLRWVVSVDEFRGVEAWLAGEADDRAGQLPVVFLRFEEPFVEPLAYADRLREQLLATIATAALEEESDIEEAPLTEFEAPPPSGQHLRDLIATAEALCAHRPVSLTTLALVLTPHRIEGTRAWMQWLREAARQLPQCLRLVVCDWREQPVLENLAEAEPELIHSEFVDLDLTGGAVEIADQAHDVEEPSGQFRMLFVRTLDAIAKGDMSAAQTQAAGALEIASRQAWGHLEVAVHFALGSGFLQAQDPERAIDLYHRAERRCVEADDQEQEQWAASLQLQSLLAMGAAAVMAGAWPQGAELYLDTQPIARTLENTRSELDCLRMASYCRTNQGLTSEAWALGLAGLELGEVMDEETRSTSTLAHLGTALESLVRRVGASWRPIERRLVAALGPDWRPTVPRGAGLGEMPGRQVPTS